MEQGGVTDYGTVIEDTMHLMWGTLIAMGLLTEPEYQYLISAIGDKPVPDTVEEVAKLITETLKEYRAKEKNDKKTK